jgi:gliding motility-associated-like protein
VVTFTNNNGCTFTDTMQVFIEDCNLFMPNVFTPDNDGINDVIAFSVEKGEILELKIQNRWGMMMYEGTNSEWNGEDKSGSPCVAGTYFYVIEFENVDGSVGVEQGWFFLSR